MKADENQTTLKFFLEVIHTIIGNTVNSDSINIIFI